MELFWMNTTASKSTGRNIPSPADRYDLFTSGSHRRMSSGQQGKLSTIERALTRTPPPRRRITPEERMKRQAAAGTRMKRGPSLLSEIESSNVHTAPGRMWMSSKFYKEILRWGMGILAWSTWPIFAVFIGVSAGVKYWLILYTAGSLAISLFAYAILRLLVYARNWTLTITIAECDTYPIWREYQEEQEEGMCVEDWLEDDSTGLYDVKLVTTVMQELRRLREERKLNNLEFALAPLFHRNHAGLDNPELHSLTPLGTKYTIYEYYDEVELCLKDVIQGYIERRAFSDGVAFLSRLSGAFGTSALCLSGGGALAMYHMGVVDVLIGSGLLPRVISGSSGGSIVAGVLAIYTDVEMKSHVLHPGVSNMHGVQWFESKFQQTMNFLNDGVIMKTEFFANTCRAYYGDYTFLEAFQRTGRVVNIVCTRSKEFSTAPIVLNYLNTPHVYIWSAVTASCSLPGLMKPTPIMCKGNDGRPVALFASGVQFADGSLSADVPMKSLSRQFNVTHFIISQVNPHVAPFLRTAPGSSWLNQAEGYLARRVMARTNELVRLGVFPTFYNESFTGVFTQKYRNTSTEDTTLICPQLAIHDYFRVISHPEYSDMVRFLNKGRLATWPVLATLEQRTRLELCLMECLTDLEQAMEMGIGDPPSEIEIAAANWNMDREAAISTDLKRFRSRQNISRSASVASHCDQMGDQFDKSPDFR